MKSAVRWFLMAVAGAAAIWAAREFLKPLPLQVETAEVRCGRMSVTVAAEGRTRVRNRFVVSVPLEGRVSRITLREGDLVKRGSVVAWLSPLPLDPRAERQRQASLEGAQADVRLAESNLARQTAELAQHSRERRRVERLVEQGIRPRQELDHASDAESNARDAVRSATAEVQSASFKVQEIRALLGSNSSDAVPLRSPVDGVILHVLQQSERAVSPGVPVVEIGDPADLDLVFEVLSTDAVRISPGASLSLGDSQGGSQGKIWRIEPSAFTKISALGVEEQRVNVIGRLSAPAPELGDGYRISGAITVWEASEVVQVPVSALFREGQQWSVFVVRDSKAERRLVEIGPRNLAMAQVISGLKEGDAVILYPDDRISDGRPVIAGTPSSI